VQTAESSCPSQKPFQQRRSRQCKAAEFRITGVVKFLCKIQKKLISIEKAWEKNTNSLFIYLNKITAVSYVDIYIVLHCTLNCNYLMLHILNEVNLFLKYLRVLQSTLKD